MSSPRYKRTSTKNLYQQKSDSQFYLVAKVDRKTVWEPLGTDVRTVAEDKLRSRLTQLRSSSIPGAGKDYTFSEAMDRLLAERELGGLDEKTLTDDKAIHKRIKATFKDCDTLVRKIDLAKLKTYFAGLTRKNGQPVSNSYFNRILGRFREIFQRAEDEGIISSNLAKKITRRPNVYAPPTIISLQDFHQIVDAMRAHGGRAVQGADMVEFMGYSGARVNEARNVRWSDVSEDTLIIRHPKGQNRGTPPREVPIGPELAELFSRLRAKRKPEEEYVLRCDACYGSLANACKKLGLPVLTHHDFRHFFSTHCLKAGIDPATTAQLVGHKDKGVTLLKTYAHITTPHVRESVKKLDFAKRFRDTRA
jgi:integrase